MIEFSGGRYDGALVTCTRREARDAVLAIVGEPEDDGKPLLGTEPCAGVTCAGADKVAFLYLGRELVNDPDSYDGEGVYHRCADGLWRPAKMKAALEL
jgi:hypothetical protein